MILITFTFKVKKNKPIKLRLSKYLKSDLTFFELRNSWWLQHNYYFNWANPLFDDIFVSQISQHLYKGSA